VSNTAKIVEYALRLTATAAMVQAKGLTPELKADLDALVQEGQDSILEPQDDGTPWTPEALRAWKTEHDALTAAIRARHTAGTDAL
jgi:hypothetical protein